MSGFEKAWTPSGSIMLGCEPTHEASKYPREVFLFFLNEWDMEWSSQVFHSKMYENALGMYEEFAKTRMYQ